MVDGLAAFTVTHLQAHLAATSLSGDLDVTTADAAIVRIETGSGTNTIDFFLMIRRPPISPLFPYTTPFRSTDGSLNAATDTGSLSVEVVANGAASSNNI